MQTSVKQKQQSLFRHVPVLNNTSIGQAACSRSVTPNKLHQVPAQRINVNMSAASMSKPTFGGQANVQVPSLQVDDLLDFKFPLKTSIREAHIEKWTNPKTGQLYNWQQPPVQPTQPSGAYKGVDLDQMLDWKYTQGKSLQAPVAMSAEQAKQNIKDNMFQKQQAANQGQNKRAAIPSMRLGAMLSGSATFDLYPPNYQKQVINETPEVRNMQGSNGPGIIENYIDQYEVFKN